MAEFTSVAAAGDIRSPVTQTRLVPLLQAESKDRSWSIPAAFHAGRAQPMVSSARAVAISALPVGICRGSSVAANSARRTVASIRCLGPKLIAHSRARSPTSSFMHAEVLNQFIGAFYLGFEQIAHFV